MPFSVPAKPMVLANLLLLCFLVTLIVSFHGVAKAGLAALYVFPVLASAFYVAIPTIILFGVLSIAMYALCVMLFSGQVESPLDFLGVETDILPSEQLWLIMFTSILLIATTLVVVIIRRRIDTLRSTLSESEAVFGDLSALYRNVVESMESGLLTTDMKGMLTSANLSAERILQTKLPLGQPLKTLGAIDQVIKKATPSISQLEAAVAMPSGAERIVGGTISPLMDRRHKQVGFLVLFQDLTDIKAMEARMRLNERLATIGELSSALAHEMRTPLASIKGCVEILRGPNPDGTIIEKIMTILIREAERVGAVVSDFLEHANPKDLKLEPIWIPDLTEEAHAACTTDPRFHGVRLQFEDAKRVWVLGDRRASHRILTNLLGNSLKAVSGRPEPRIEVAQKIVDGMVVLAITDNGIGMGKAQARNIFTPFHSGFAEGTGIGMSLVFQFAQRMGWEIEVTSEVNIGTTITIAMRIEPTA
jgi:two-component system sensor histidine kinase PilS (NtrC family)